MKGITVFAVIFIALAIGFSVFFSIGCARVKYVGDLQQGCSPEHKVRVEWDFFDYRNLFLEKSKEE